MLLSLEFRPTMRTYVLCMLLIAFTGAAQRIEPDSGLKSFEIRCTVCHGGDGNGNERAPGILNFVATNSDDQIAALIRKGVRAMPPHDIVDPEMKNLLAFLHTLRPIRSAGLRQPRRATAKLQDGTILPGSVLNESHFDMQLQTADGKIHRLVREGDVYREPSVGPKMDWPRYDGSFTGNRDSPLDQINTSNVSRLS